MKLSLPWPLPALATWALCWAVFLGATLAGVSPSQALVAATVLGLVLAQRTPQIFRRLWVALGFPLSVTLLLGADFSAWVWLLPVVVLLLLYPLRAWKDAPLFPTPEHALNDLPQYAPLLPHARVLDAGCGLGHGLQALQQAYPLAQFTGVEWSRVLAWICARRCRWAQIQRGDMWQTDWSGYDLVYLFQRPESMAQALQKARAELKDGAFLVSLEFEIADIACCTQFFTRAGKPVWVYSAQALKSTLAH